MFWYNVRKITEARPAARDAVLMLKRLALALWTVVGTGTARDRDRVPYRATG